jgi:glutaryl-CoA dehydrogenase
MPSAPARPLDLLATDWLLTEEERAGRDLVRQYADKHLRPQIAEWFEHGQPPVREVARGLGELGLLGMSLTGYGCAGAEAVSYGLTCLELEAVDSGLRSLVSVQGSLAMYAIWRFGSEEQKQEWLPRMAAGAALGCFGLTEAEAGSDPGSMRTTARRDGTDWLISGGKLWITNGGVAAVAVVWARTDEGVRGFLVPTDSPGFTARDVGAKLSLRASVTSELSFEDVRLPGSAQLPGTTGLGSALACLNEARFGVLFGVLGAARDCLEVAQAYAGERAVFGRPLGAYQLTQAKLVDMALELHKGYLLALHLGRLKERGELAPAQVSLGKLNNVREALAIAREARTVLGANGITLAYSPLRHANNLESVLTYEGTSEVHTLVVGEALTGHPAYR